HSGANRQTGQGRPADRRTDLRRHFAIDRSDRPGRGAVPHPSGPLRRARPFEDRAVILEGLVTTLSAAGEVNLAPMGPPVPDDTTELRRFTLRPFRTAQTYTYLKAHGEGVLHVSDDVLLLAQAAISRPEPFPALVPATLIRGFVLADCCRYHEFRIVSLEEAGERASFQAEAVHTGRVRDFFGFNRGNHAVLEAAILATRTAFLPLADVEAEFARLTVLVEKTGGPREHQALAFLRRHLEEVKTK